MLETTFINFDNLSAFSNNNEDFNKKLLLAFLDGLEKLRSVLKVSPTEEEVITGRKVIHTIYPSLKMLQTTALNEKIEKYSLFLKGQALIAPEDLTEISELIKTIEFRVKEKLAADK